MASKIVVLQESPGPIMQFTDGEGDQSSDLMPRNSELGRLEKGPNASELLASSVRQAKASFAAGDRTSFDDVVKLTEKVGADFLVPKAQGYEAQLDIHAGMLASGAVSLHDGNMPLRTLGSGSSRLMVAGVQNSGPKQNITLVDELELGLEPHRIMRLLRFLRTGFPQEGDFGSRRIGCGLCHDH